MHPTTVEGFQEAWAILERLWAATVDRARALPPELLHERVRDEWSFIETLRHLGFASAAWVGRMVLGDPSPWHPLDLPWDEAPGWDGHPLGPRGASVAGRGPRRTPQTPGHGPRRDRRADPRAARQTVTRTEPGWPQLEDFPLAQCLFIVVNEEWHHRLYAERDLDALTATTKEN